MLLQFMETCPSIFTQLNLTKNIWVLSFWDIQRFKSTAFIKILKMLFEENIFPSHLLINVDSVIQT